MPEDGLAITHQSTNRTPSYMTCLGYADVQWTAAALLACTRGVDEIAYRGFVADARAQYFAQGDQCIDDIVQSEGLAGLYQVINYSLVALAEFGLIAFINYSESGCAKRAKHWSIVPEFPKEVLPLLVD